MPFARLETLIVVLLLWAGVLDPAMLEGYTDVRPASYPEDPETYGTHKEFTYKVCDPLSGSRYKLVRYEAGFSI